MTDYLIAVPAAIYIIVSAETRDAALALAQGTTWDLEGITLVDFKHPDEIRFDGLSTEDSSVYIVEEDYEVRGGRMTLYVDMYRNIRVQCDGCQTNTWVGDGIVSSYWHIAGERHYCGACWDQIKKGADAFGQQCSFPLFEPAISERQFFRCVEANTFGMQCAGPGWGTGVPKAHRYIHTKDNSIELRRP